MASNRGGFGSLPLAHSTPVDRTLIATRNGQAHEHNLQDVCEILANMDDPENPDISENAMEIDEDVRLTKDACIEIVLAFLLNQAPQNVHEVPDLRLLEILCFSLEKNLLNESDGQSRASLLASFRSLLPLFVTYLIHPVIGPWTARMICVYYCKDGVIPNDIVYAFLSALERTPARFSVLRSGLLASLDAFNPFNPQIRKNRHYSRDFSKSRSFPDYSIQIDQSVSNVALKTEIVPLSGPTFLSTWAAAFPLNGQETGLCPPEAIKDRRNFIPMCKRMKYPDHVECFLSNEAVQKVYWLSVRNKPNKDVDMRIMDIADRFKMDTVDVSSQPVEECGTDIQAKQLNIEAVRELLAREEIYRHNVLEGMPAITRVICQIMDDASCPIDLFILCVEHISLLQTSGTGQLTDYIFQLIATVFHSADVQEQISILKSVLIAIGNFEKDLPRLWHLEAISHMSHRKNMSLGMYANEDVADMACAVDTVATLTSIKNLLDGILWQPLLSNTFSRGDSILMWDVVLKIWTLLADIATTEQISKAVSLIPHPSLIRAALAHFMPLIVVRVEAYVKRLIRCKDLRRDHRRQALRSIYDSFRDKR